MTTQDLVPNDLDVQIGLLTISQAAAKLAYAFPANSDVNLLMQRLIARGSITTVDSFGKTFIATEELARFMRAGAANASGLAAMGLPAETPAPIFPFEGNWFGNPLQYQLVNLSGAVYNALVKQMPQNLSPSFQRRAAQKRQQEIASQQGVLFDQRASVAYQLKTETDAGKQADLRSQVASIDSNMSALTQENIGIGSKLAALDAGTPMPPTLNLTAQLTPELRSILTAPVSTPNPVFGITWDGASMFKNIAEFFVAVKLQDQARLEIQHRAHANMLALGAEGVSPLYATSEAYKSIVEAAIATCQSRTLISTISNVSQDDPETADTMRPLVLVTLTMATPTLLELAGTNWDRLARLAF